MNRITASCVAILAMASGLSACSAPVDADPTLPLAQLDEMQRAMARPPVDPDASYETASVKIDLPIPLAAFRTWFAIHGGPQPDTYLIGTASVPGVARAEPLTGSWQKAGDRRRLVMTDGHTSVEEIIESTSGRFRHVNWNSTNKTGRYTRYSISDFVFTGDARGTQLEWTYKFRPKIWIDGPLIRSSIEKDFRDYMNVGLLAMRKQAISDVRQH